jgi:transglutaminase-like putative cysteine protease
MNKNIQAMLAATAAAIALAALAATGCHSLAGERIHPDAGTDADTDADTDTDTSLEGSLIKGIHHTELEYLDGLEAGIVWLPLPADRATQVPLYVELTVDPPELVEQIDYSVDPWDNFGTMVRFVHDDTAELVTLHWDAIVMTRDVTDEERPLFYAGPGGPQEWTAATQAVDASHEGIANTAASLTSDEPTALDKMIAILEWTSSNLDFPTDWSNIDSVDATAAFELGESSSPGFANLAAALGRASGIPTRTVAGLYVGMSQNTHFMSEFHLGDDLGWRRVEPQKTHPVLSEGYALLLRTVLTDDEGEPAFADEIWTYPGVPVYSVIHPAQGYARMVPDYQPEYFDDCAGCDNRAELSAELDGSAGQIAEVFDRARELWQRDLDGYLEGTLAEEIMDARRAALDAADLDDVIAILDQIE